MNLEDFNDPDFDMGGPSMGGIDDRPISQMFAEPLHVDGGGADFGGFDSNFDSDFGGFDAGFSGLDNDFGAMSTASLPPLNSIPSMSDSGMSDSFGGGFGARAPPPPSSQAPVFVRSNQGFVPGGGGKLTVCCCVLLYALLLALLIVSVALSAIVLYKEIGRAHV